MQETKTVLITGAASGIGRAVAERLASDKLNLVLVDLDPEIEIVANQLEAQCGLLAVLGIP